MPYPEGSSFADQHAALVKAMTEYVAKVNYGPQKFFATQSEAARTAEDFAFHSLKPFSVVQLHYRWWAQTEPLTLDYLHRTGISKPVDDKRPGFRLYAKLLQGQALADILPEVQASDKEHVSAWGSLMETRMGTPIPKDVAQFLVDDGFFNRRNSPVPDLAKKIRPRHPQPACSKRRPSSKSAAICRPSVSVETTKLAASRRQALAGARQSKLCHKGRKISYTRRLRISSLLACRQRRQRNDWSTA